MKALFVALASLCVASRAATIKRPNAFLASKFDEFKAHWDSQPKVQDSAEPFATQAAYNYFDQGANWESTWT